MLMFTGIYRDLLVFTRNCGTFCGTLLLPAIMSGQTKKPPQGSFLLVLFWILLQIHDLLHLNPVFETGADEIHTGG